MLSQVNSILLSIAPVHNNNIPPMQSISKDPRHIMHKNSMVDKCTHSSLFRHNIYTVEQLVLFYY